MPKQRGRPKRYPDLNIEDERNDLIKEACALYATPYDDREERDPAAPSIYYVAKQLDISCIKARKLLISGGYYSNEISRQINGLLKEGKSIPEICDIVDASRATVHSYIPHGKGAYNLEKPGRNAEGCKVFRDRKKAVANLTEYIQSMLLDDLVGDEMVDEKAALLLWKTVIAFEGYPFETVKGKRFKYTVSSPGGSGGRHYRGQSVYGYGNEIVVSGQKGSISRSTVDLAFRNAMEKEITGVRSLGVPGAGSYLYPMLVRFGVITTTERAY